VSISLDSEKHETRFVKTEIDVVVTATDDDVGGGAIRAGRPNLQWRLAIARHARRRDLEKIGVRKEYDHIPNRNDV
jgi:hypothetical protein